MFPRCIQPGFHSRIIDLCVEHLRTAFCQPVRKADQLQQVRNSRSTRFIVDHKEVLFQQNGKRSSVE